MSLLVKMILLETRSEYFEQTDRPGHSPSLLLCHQTSGQAGCQQHLNITSGIFTIVDGTIHYSIYTLHN